MLDPEFSDETSLEDRSNYPSSVATILWFLACSFYAAGDCDGLPGLGAEPDDCERLRSFLFRFCASSCFFFFFTEGFS